MPHSIFGWSLPAGAGEEDYPEPNDRYHCGHCGAFLPMTPDKTEPWTAYYKSDGGSDSDEVIDSGTTLIWTCRRCKKEHQIDV